MVQSGSRLRFSILIIGHIKPYALLVVFCSGVYLRTSCVDLRCGPKQTSIENRFVFKIIFNFLFLLAGVAAPVSPRRPEAASAGAVPSRCELCGIKIVLQMFKLLGQTVWSPRPLVQGGWRVQGWWQVQGWWRVQGGWRVRRGR